MGFLVVYVLVKVLPPLDIDKRWPGGEVGGLHSEQLGGPRGQQRSPGVPDLRSQDSHNAPDEACGREFPTQPDRQGIFILMWTIIVTPFQRLDYRSVRGTLPLQYDDVTITDVTITDSEDQKTHRYRVAK